MTTPKPSWHSKTTPAPARIAPRRLALLCAAIASITGLAPAARAQIGSDRYSSIVIDVGSGKVLSDVQADAPRYPASLTKLMTLYMLFEALRDHRVALDQLVPISAHAAAVEPSKLGLVPGSRMTVEEGILGLVTKSANDAATALGELLGGDEARFAEMMTLRARALGMTHTTFRNASGLPDPDQISTARDIALLARHLIQDFPAQYAYFSVPSFRFHGQTIYNHDRMLMTYPGADGLKTGYTVAAGHNLATSAIHGDVRLVGVVLGAVSNPQRDQEMAALLNAGFSEENAPPMAPTSVAPTLMARAHLPSLVETADAASLPARLRHRRSAPMTPLLANAPAGGWGVQLGSYTSAVAAQRVAAAARSGADTGIARISAAKARGKRVWRVQLIGLTPQQAQAACAASSRAHASCVKVRINPQLASR